MKNKPLNLGKHFLAFIQGRTSLILCFLFLFRYSSVQAADNPDQVLHARGYNIIPSPQQVELGAGEVEVDETWVVSSNVGEDIAF